MSKITSSSTAEYFAKNLQQVGFSSPVKAVLTTLKEAVDNSLDACEEEGLLPEISISIQKVGKGHSKTADLIEIVVEDNGPGIDQSNVAQVFGEYLASSKFGRGQCTRGQQGIGISAATTWAQLTNASGVNVMTKTKGMRKAFQCTVDVDIKGNKGLIKNKEMVDWDKPHGTRVEFHIDGRVQLNGDGGLLTYIDGTALVNPHLQMRYKLLEEKWIDVPRVSDTQPEIPSATLPHLHTMKLGEFMTHASLYGKLTLANFLKKGFSRVSDQTLQEIVKKGLPKGQLNKNLSAISQSEYKQIFQVIQDTELQSPSTRSVLTIGEEGLSKSIKRLGEIDFFSVVTRKPKICDFKPVVVEVAIARLLNRPGEPDDAIQLLRFANRVPLQFDKASCAITHAVTSVNWRSYGLNQSKDNLPTGQYVFAISVTSPFIKFKNASKETIDASEELVEEIRRTLMQAGQKLSRHIRAEFKAEDLERKLQHIEKFAPILVEGLAKIVNAPAARKKKAEEGLKTLLGRDTKEAESQLQEAETKLAKLKSKLKSKLGEDEEPQAEAPSEDPEIAAAVEDAPTHDDKKAAKGTKKKAPAKKK